MSEEMKKPIKLELSNEQLIIISNALHFLYIKKEEFAVKNYDLLKADEISLLHNNNFEIDTLNAYISSCIELKNPF